MQAKPKVDRKGFLSRYGPWAVVAGASEGLGAAYSRALASRGLNLVLVARRDRLLEALAARIEADHDVRILTLALDLARSETFDRLTRALEGLEVRLLVYNAGFSVEGPFLGKSLEEHLEEVDTNMVMPLRLVYRLGDRMLAAGHGGMILMSSLSSFQGSAYISNYSATKAYNLILAEGLWEEWRRQGVDVLACAAGAVRTPNYVSSRPKSTGRLADATMEPELVVEQALAALGHRPSLIPGRMNRLSSFVMRRLLSRRAAIGLMGSVLRKMYVDDNTD